MTPKEKRWLELMKEANPPPVPMTKEEKLKRFDFGAYLRFLHWGKNFVLGIKGSLPPHPADAAETIHRQALKLNKIRYDLYEPK